jgi:hypothetical protein
MPVKVRKRYKNEGGKLWKIVSASNPKKVYGQSDTKKKAQASAAFRNRAYRRK